VLLAAAASVQLTLLAVIVLRPAVQDLDALTSYGALHFHPERDSLLYLGSILAGLVLLCAAVVARRGTTASLRGPAIQCAVAVAGTALAVNQFFQARAHLVREDPVPGFDPVVFAALLAVTIAAAFLGGRPSPQPVVAPEEPRGRLKFSPLDLIVPLLVISVIYVPSGRLLAGRFFFEELIGHWDYYVMAPALAFKHGLALGTDVSTMYGVGWPMVLSAVFSWVTPSFGRLIQIGSVYVCVYLSAVYLLLRLLVRRPALAALGTLLAASHMFLGLGSEVIWRFPSMTVLRSAFDVWVFIALSLHWKTGRRRWAAAAGVLTGLAVAFGTDTGLCLGAACGFYWLGLMRMDDGKRGRLFDLASFGAASLATLVVALVVASRGSILSGEFWSGWLESILEFGQGFISTPLSTGPDVATVLIFVVAFFTYMAFFSNAVAGLITKRSTQQVLFNGLLALYGLLTMLQFLGKSDLFHYRLTIPLVVIGCNVAGRALDRRQSADSTGRPRGLALPAAVVLTICLAVLLAPKAMLVEPIGLYPSPAWNLLSAKAPDGVCLSTEPRDICGLSPELKEPAAEFREVSREVAGLAESGKTVAVIGETGSLPYLKSGSAPWGRYPRLFVDTITKEKLEGLVDALRRDPPDYVFLRLPTESALMAAVPGDTGGLSDEDYRQFYRAVVFGVGPGPNSPYPDTWEALESAVEKSYELDGANAAYEVWKLKPAGSEQQF
jgi:hypothetical protein